MNPNLDELEKLARAATPGMRTLAHMIPDSVIWGEKEGEFAILRGSKPDIELAAACDPDTILGLVARIRELEALRQIVQHEVAYYDQAWLEEHARDDHMNTMDHKDEISVAESLLAIKAALTSSEPM